MLQHRIVLDAERDHDGRVFRALALVDGRRIGQFQLIELAEAVDDGATIEVDSEFALFHIDACNDAEVAIVDLLS